MQIQLISTLAALLLLFGSGGVLAQALDGRDVEVRIVNDRGRPFPDYPMRRSGRNVYKAYLEAVRDSDYSIRVRNRSNQRIGVVVAVDGRNIISGEASRLSSRERMYVLEPGQQETYEGWRTGKNRVNRFYFTDAGDSYAGAWGDTSDLGIIAVAAFQEVERYRPEPQPWAGGREQERRKYSSAQGAPPAATQSLEGAPAPGTGYGDSTWSPSRRVDFDPESRPFAKFLFRYAWRKVLCQEGVIDCGRRPRTWERGDDYAPPPPRYERRGNYDD